MIETTETKEVENKLKEYKNLKMISHDRGIQYVNISNEYIHVLDRFHLLQNLFKSIKEKINTEFSNVIKFSKKVDSIKEVRVDKTTKLNAKQLVKKDMITKARKHRKKGLSFSEISRIMNLDRRTIKKFCDAKDINSLLNITRNKKSMYDKDFDVIKNLFNDGYSVKNIYNKIHVNDNNYKLNSLRHYVRNRLGTESVKKRGLNKFNYYTIKKSHIVKDIICAEQKLTKDNEIALKKFYNNNSDYMIIKKFYHCFKYQMVNLNASGIKKILKRSSKVKIIDKYIEGLKNNYISVINACKYKENNSIVEGTIRRLKSIKSEMFGKGSFKLLRAKSIFCSNFFSNNN